MMVISAIGADLQRGFLRDRRVDRADLVGVVKGAGTPR
jgi:hypothetical protein